MALRVCLACRTAYAVGLQACPQCGEPTRNAIYDWEDDVAKASAFGATFYVGEGDAVPTDLPEGVRMVGPGAPVPPEPEPAAEPAAAESSPEPAAAEPVLQPGAGPDAAEEDGPADYASYPVAVLRDLARERGITQHGVNKADLAAALTAWDAEHPDGD